MKIITLLIFIITIGTHSTAAARCIGVGVFVGGYPTQNGHVDTYQCPNGTYIDIISAYDDDGNLVGITSYNHTTETFGD